MNTAVINVRIDPKIKRQAQKTATEIGVSLSDVINASLREFVRKKTVTFRSQEFDVFVRRPLEEIKVDLARTGKYSESFIKSVISGLKKSSVYEN